jgi:hypothetical protein
MTLSITDLFATVNINNIQHIIEDGLQIHLQLQPFTGTNKDFKSYIKNAEL